MGHREGSWPKLVTFRSTLEGCPFKVGPNDRAHIAICESGAFVCAAPKDQRTKLFAKKNKKTRAPNVYIKLA